MRAFLLYAPRRGGFSPVALRFSGLLAAAIMLAGCVQDSVSSNLNTPHASRPPERQLADYLSTDCLAIWAQQEPEAIANPLYWLRGMDCAERLPPAEARAEARQLASGSWADTFKRGILLAKAKITPDERQSYMARLDALSGDVPSQVRPLFQLWRDGQNSLLNLASERSRYSKLQQATDSELDTLREQQQRLRSQLELTTRKLENLTDIERQLSSRKPGSAYAPENHNAAESDEAESATSGKEAKP